MLLDCGVLHLELAAGVSGTAHPHGLWVEGVDFKEVAECRLLKPVPVPPSRHFAQFHESSLLIWVILL